MKFGVIFALFLSAALCTHAEHLPKDVSMDCTDGTCSLPTSGEAILSVVSPVPETAQNIQAPSPHQRLPLAASCASSPRRG